MRAHTRPLMVTGLGSAEEVCRPLERAPLKVGREGKAYDERWLQDTLLRHPHLLPVDEIEPALTPLVPICTELGLRSGSADNLLITPDGGIVLVEAKLWRNPEARREVVGQVLDYAKDLQALDYTGLQAAVRAATKSPTSTLFGLVHPEGDPAREGVFVDAVSRNLRLGRFLLLIAGDGIQESAEALADFMQRHIGLHFTLALVELGLWRAPGGEVLVTPRVVARTVQIERAVVRLEAGMSAAAPGASRIEPVAASASAPRTLTEAAFDEELEKHAPGLAPRLRAFVASLEPLGVYGDLKASLLLKAPLADGRATSLATIDTQGRVFTDGVPAAAMALGRLDLADAYKAALAAALPGGAVQATGKVMGVRLVVDGRTPTLAQLIDHSDAWAAAISDYLHGLQEAATRR